MQERRIGERRAEYGKVPRGSKSFKELVAAKELAVEAQERFIRASKAVQSGELEGRSLVERTVQVDLFRKKFDNLNTKYLDLLYEYNQED